MTLLYPQLGERFVVSDGLLISVIKTDAHGVTFGVLHNECRPPEAGCSRQMAEVCRNRSCYFLFTEDGCRIVVVRCERGKSIMLTGACRLTVVAEWSGGITVSITGMSTTEPPSRVSAPIYNQVSALPSTDRRCPPQPWDTGNRMIPGTLFQDIFRRQISAEAFSDATCGSEAPNFVCGIRGSLTNPCVSDFTDRIEDGY